MTTAPPTKIDKTYLQKVQGAFELLLQDVKNQINGIGLDGGIMIPAVSASLNEYFSPGGAAAKGVTGTYSLPFVPAVDLYTQVGTMGDSIGSELKYLEKILQDIISGITTTLNNFGTAEDINTDSVDHLLQEFKSVVADLSNPPGSSSTGQGQQQPG
jgi:hypothetical protein